MLARIKAIIKHLERSYGDEYLYTKEESCGYYADEDMYYCPKKDLMERCKQSIKTSEQQIYFTKLFFESSLGEI